MLVRRNNRTLLLLIMVLLLTNGIMLYLVTRADEKPKEPELSRSERMVKMVQEELALDSLQVRQYISLRNMRDSLLKPVQADMRSSKMAILEMVKGEHVDSAALKIALDKVGESQKRIETEYFYHFRRMTGLLRQEQLPKFDSLLTRMVNRSTGIGDQNGRIAPQQASQTNK